MIEIRIGLLCCLGMLVLFGLLKLANLKKSERYQQLWLLSVSILYVISFLLLNDRLAPVITEPLYKVIPILESFSVLTLNFALLTLFLSLKFAGQQAVKTLILLKKKRKQKERTWIGSFTYIKILLSKAFRRKLYQSDPTTVSFVYTKKGNKVYLKPEWKFARMLFMFGTWILASVLLVLAGFVSYEGSHYVISLFGEYPSLSFLLFAEFAWFFGGLQFEKQTGTIHGQDVELNKHVDYERLFEEYKRLWPERILKSDFLTENSFVQEHYYYEKMTDHPHVQLKINQLCERLKREGFIIRESYCRIFRDIIEEKDVLIEDPFYTDLAPYLFPALYHLLARDRKLAVLAASTSHALDIVSWFQKGINQEEEIEIVFTIAVLQDAIEQNLDPDVVVLTPADLIKSSSNHYIYNRVATKRIHGIIIIEGDRIINEHGMMLYNFMHKLKDIGGMKPQSIVLSRWQEDLEQSVRHLLGADPRDTEPAIPSSRKLYYMLWKKEGEELFQQKILSRMVHRRIEMDAVLAIPAIKYGVERIAYLNPMKAPIMEGLEELKDNQEQLIPYTQDMYNLDSLFERSVFHRNHLEVPLENYQFAIVRDHENNIVDSLSQWLPASKEIGFIHVVSQPYLLRDYLIDNSDYYIGNNRKISPISVRVSKSMWSSAYNLLERLCAGDVSEAEVEQLFIRNNISQETLAEGIGKLLNATFKQKIDFEQLLDIKIEQSFNRQKMAFEEHLSFRLPAGLQNSLLPSWFTVYEIQTQSGIVLESIMKGHVYQNYQVGQLCSFHGKLYKVRQIDHSRKIVELSFEVPHLKEHYRSSRSYHLEEPLTKDSHIERMDRYTINSTISESHVQVYSTGYFCFEGTIDLVSEKTKFIPIKKEETSRTYRNGKVLEITIQSLGQQFDSPDQIACTLSFLFNEVFFTLFPHNYQYIAVCTTLPDSYFAEDSFGENFKLFMPKLTYTGKANLKDQLTLFIIEDSPFHLGILESIQSRFFHILEIVDDYLYWVLEENNDSQNTEYIRLGAPTVQSYFNLKETAKLVRKLLPSNSLRENRLSYQSREIKELESIEKTETCHFCGEFLPVSEFDVLNDGRKRCYLCKQSGIDTVESLRALNDVVRKIMNESLSVQIKREIELEMVSAEEMQRRIGESLLPVTDMSQRVVGRAMMGNDQTMSIVIENGSPRNQTAGTLAHEFTHIWQYEHIIIEDFSLEVLEGHAVWTEIFICEQLGERLYAEKIKADMQYRNDEYGNGYRQMLALLKEKNCLTPFELLLQDEIRS